MLQNPRFAAQEAQEASHWAGLWARHSPDPTVPNVEFKPAAEGAGQFSRDGNLRMVNNHYAAGARCYPAIDTHVVGVVLERKLEVRTWTPSDGLRVSQLARGHVMVLPAGEPFRIECNVPHRAVVIHIRPEALSSVNAQHRTDSAWQQLRTAVGIKDPVLQCIGEAMVGQSVVTDDDTSPLLDMASAALGAHLLNHYAADTAKVQRGVLGARHLNLIDDYLRENLERPLRLDALAARVGYSACHFSHLFKATTGLSPMRYAMDYKMKCARKLIESTAMPLTEVGLSLGFSDLAHFSRTFKGFWKTKPSSVQRRIV